MAKIVFPISVRRKALRLFSNGHPAPKIAAMLGCSKETVKSWCKEAKVYSKSNLTDEELDQKIVDWGLDPKFDDSRVAYTTPETAARKTNIRKSHRSKFGPSPLDKEAAIKSLDTVEDPDAYAEAITEHLANVNEQLSYDNTLPEQVKTLTAGLLLRQLKMTIECPPPVVTWTDAERVIKLLRLTLGMDIQKDTEKKRIDLTIINGKTSKPRPRPKIIEVPAEAELPESI